MSSGSTMALIVSANSLLKVAGFSGETVRVLEQVQCLSRKTWTNAVWTACNSSRKDLERSVTSITTVSMNYCMCQQPECG